MTAFMVITTLTGCVPPSSSGQMAQRQEQQLQQSVGKVGIPYLPNARELQLIHDIYQLRDKPTPTYVYVFSSMQGCFVYLGSAIGYPIPYAAQMTSPRVPYSAGATSQTLRKGDDQAEPNGLFMPESAEGTWIMVPKPDSTTGEVEARYFEERINVTQTRLAVGECKTK
jgi:hypothetical protein